VCGYLGLCTQTNKAEAEDAKVVSHRKLLAQAVVETAQQQQLQLPQQSNTVKDDQTCQLCEMAVTYLKVSCLLCQYDMTDVCYGDVRIVIGCSEAASWCAHV
jgi:hypothetical protein